MKFSIITPVFNREKVILRNIASVKSQDYSDFEHLIIDGCSTDNTIKKIKGVKHHRLTLFSEKDDGIYDAMNKGINLASGEIIGILNSDDLYFDERVLSSVAESFISNPDLDILFGSVNFFKELDQNSITRLYSTKFFKPWKLFLGMAPPHPGMFVKRSTFLKIGNYDPIYEISGDFEWIVRALLIEQVKYEVSPSVIVKMQSGGVSSNGIKSYFKSSLEMFNALHKNEKNSYGLILLRLPVKLVELFIFKIKKNS